MAALPPASAACCCGANPDTTPACEAAAALADRDRQIDALQYEAARSATEREWMQASLAAAALLLRDRAAAAPQSSSSSTTALTARPRRTRSSRSVGQLSPTPRPEFARASSAPAPPLDAQSSAEAATEEASDSPSASPSPSPAPNPSNCDSCLELQFRNELLTAQVEDLVRVAAAAVQAESVASGCAREDDNGNNNHESDTTDNADTSVSPASRAPENDASLCASGSDSALSPAAANGSRHEASQCGGALDVAEAGVQVSIASTAAALTHVSSATSNPAMWPYAAYAQGQPVAPVTCVPKYDAAAQHPAAFGLFVPCRMAPAFMSKLRAVHGSLEDSIRDGTRLRESAQARDTEARKSIAELESALAVAEQGAVEQQQAHERELRSQARRLAELESLVQHLTLKSERIAEAAQRNREPMAQVVALRDELSRAEAINANLNDQIVGLSAQIATHTDEMRDALRAVEIARVDRLDLTKQVRMLQEQLRTAHADLATSRLETNNLRRSASIAASQAPTLLSTDTTTLPSSSRGSAVHPAVALMQHDLGAGSWERTHSAPETGASSPLLSASRNSRPHIHLHRQPRGSSSSSSSTDSGVNPARHRRSSPLGTSSPPLVMMRSMSNPEGQLSDRIAAANAAADLFTPTTAARSSLRREHQPTTSQQQHHQQQQQQRVLSASTVVSRSRTGLNPEDGHLHAAQTGTSTTFVKSY